MSRAVGSGLSEGPWEGTGELDEYEIQGNETLRVRVV